MNCDREPRGLLKGGHAYPDLCSYGNGSYESVLNGYAISMPKLNVQANRWSATEYNRNNSWNSNFGNGNFNNNNKYNSFGVRPVVAFDTPTDFLDLVLFAFDDCCKYKRTSRACIDYCEIAEHDLPALANELYTGTYKPGVSTCFLVKYPKYREVFAACFRDRIVHHFIILLLNPYFERRFVEQGNVSFNCRKGFGTLAAQQAVYENIKKATCNYSKPAWVFKGDIVSFFMSIDKRILWAKLEPFIREQYKGAYLQQLLAASKTIVFHCPELNCVFNTSPDEWPKHIERHKSLFGSDAANGMPIGNITTQVFVNFLMSFFDDFVIQWFKCRDFEIYYTRFVDDFVVICISKSALKAFIIDARLFLSSELGITLHVTKYHFQLASHGVMFVGAYIRYYRIYLSSRTVARFRERVFGFNQMLREKPHISLCDLRRIEQVINSYLGFFKNKRSYLLRKTTLSIFEHVFYEFFYIHGHFERIRLRNKCKMIQTSIL